MQEKYEDCRKNAPKMHAEATYYAAKWTKQRNLHSLKGTY